ncbi:MAG TPA: helix-turn-helix domain-containing protein, partial [Candidatus Limnocylindrales bacterium]|nr:helix-turn-helix domain-containing protein [Candidatus Limnocylindrales bacterium]
MPNSLQSRPIDATLSVTKAARLLGVHPNTIRTWSDAGRLRYFRINARGDRRYRLGDLQRFLASAEPHPVAAPGAGGPAWAAARRPAGRTGTADGSRAHLPRDDVSADPLDGERHHLDLSVASTIARLGSGLERTNEPLLAAAQAVRHAYGHYLVAVFELRGDRLVARAVASANPSEPIRLADLPRRFGILGAALDAEDDAWRRRRRDGRDGEPGGILTDSAHEAILPVLPDGRPELAVPIQGAEGPWGVLLIVGEAPGSLGPRDLETTRLVADGIATVLESTGRAEEIAHLRHRAEALRRVAGDIGSRLDLDRILSGLVDHTMVLFEGDAAAVFLQRPDGQITAEVSRGLSTEYLNSVREFRER